MTDPARVTALERARLVTRRTALAGVGAAALGYALWPRRPRGALAVPAGRTEVTYWEKWTGGEGEAVQAVVDRFNAAQDRIWVRRVPVSDIGPKAMVAIGGGDPPDLVGLFNFHIPLFAEAGAILPMSSFPPASARGDSVDPARYAPAIRRLLTHEGEQWAGVATCHTMALYYNRRLLSNAGFAPPRTVDDLDRTADALTRPGADGRLEQVGFLPNLPKWWPNFWPAMFGGTLYDPALDRATLHTPENVAAYEWVAGYPQRYGAEATTAFAAGFGRSFNSALDPFLTERAAMIVQGPWMARLAALHAPGLDYGCVPAPVGPGLDPDVPPGMLEADVIMIPRGARRPDEAFEFLAFTQRQDVQEALAAAHCKPSPLADVSARFTETHPNPYVAVHDRVAKSPIVQAAPATRVWAQYADLIAAAFDRMWAGADVARELAAVQTRAQELLDLAARRRAQRGTRSAGAAPAAGEAPPAGAPS